MGGMFGYLFGVCVCGPLWLPRFGAHVKGWRLFCVERTRQHQTESGVRWWAGGERVGCQRSVRTRRWLCAH